MPTVLIHGFPTSPALWRNVIRRLENAHVIAWELMGYGGSIEAGRDRDASLPAQARCLAAFMDEAGIQGAIVAGHGIGGGIAQILAVERPDLVRGIVLVSSASYEAWPSSSVRMIRAFGPILRYMPNALIKGIVHRVIRRGHDDGVVGEESFKLHGRWYETGNAAAALVRQVQAMNVADTQQIAHRLPGLEIPARVVWGASDPFLRLDHAHRLSTVMRAPLDVVDRGRHFLPEDHADRVAAAVNSLIRALSEPGARPSRKHATHSSVRSAGSGESRPSGAPAARGSSRGASSSPE